ncbi:MAG: hypothetical protein KGJ13_05390 [Patescibacteria group bacterium]|nr:hypothetical protein [Patescibacteria group bacterium]
MEGTEHRDIYIALGVGGVALVLIYLYLYSGSNVPTGADGTPIPTAADTSVPQTPYNYNVAPYNPPLLTPNPPQTLQPLNNVNQSNNCSGCSKASKCGSFNNSNPTSTYQYNTLVGYGADAGA